MNAPPDLELPGGMFATADRFLWHAATQTAVLSDLHLGAEAELTRRGIFMPDISVTPLRTSWARMASRKPRNVIIAGDLFDTGSPDRASIELAVELFASLETCKVTLVRGNHDPAPSRLQTWLPTVTLESEASVGGYRIQHGHEAIASPHALVVGHQHPTVILRDRVSAAKMPCFAICSATREKLPLILLPAFTRAPLGSNLLAPTNWLLATPRPRDADIRIAGIVASKTAAPQILDFGSLDLLRNLNA
jgi:putative SbcD/Mre11-related phosphoesterase